MIAGRIMILPKGDWNADTTYKMLDLVLYEGKSWLAKKTNVNTMPSADNSAYWQLFTDIPDLTDEQASRAVDKYLQIGHIVTTNETAEGIEYTITSINGTDTVLIRHGAKGDKGDAGGVLIGTLEHLEHLGELKIYHVTKEEYEAVLASGNFDDNALYVTPDEEYATPDDVTEAINSALENAKETGMFFSEKDVIITMVEAGLLNALLDEEGNILTDENGNVLLDETKRCVTSVNGVKPDENGNVYIEVGSDADWNTLLNKPFEMEETRELWYEGSGQAAETFLPRAYPDVPSSLYDLMGKSLLVTFNGVEYRTTCTMEGAGVLTISFADGYELYEVVTEMVVVLELKELGETYDIKIEVIDSAIPDSVIPDSIARLDDIPEVTPHDWNTLLNKPTEIVGGDTLTWDGDTSGKTGYNIGIDLLFYHVSDSVPTMSDLTNGATVILSNGVTQTITSENIQEPVSGFLMLSSTTVLYLVVPTDNNSDSGITFEKKGIYVAYDETFHPISLTINGYTGFTKEVLKEEYLPDTVPTNTETWTFTLEDGSTVTKEVYVK